MPIIHLVKIYERIRARFGEERMIELVCSGRSYEQLKVIAYE